MCLTACSHDTANNKDVIFLPENTEVLSVIMIFVTILLGFGGVLLPRPSFFFLSSPLWKCENVRFSPSPWKKSSFQLY